MEHIVQFAIGIDDEAINRNIIKHAEKKIMEDITHDVKCQLFASSPYTASGLSREPSDYVKKKIDLVLEQNKDEIIKAAAIHLADRLSRTKKCREAVDEVLENL